MSIDETAMLLSGQLVRTQFGTTYYFDQPGNWVNGSGWGDTDHLHRDDGPALVWDNGDQEWWVNGLRHREDGPAIIWVSGAKEWWVNGRRHRVDGPAVMYSGGDQEWWVDGAFIK